MFPLYIKKGDSIMCTKSYIYVANTTPQDVAAGSRLDLGTVVRRVGNGIRNTGGNLSVIGKGYYSGNLLLKFTGSAGTTTIKILEDGTAIPPMPINIITAAGTDYMITIPFPVRNFCCEEKTIAVEIGGVAITDAIVGMELEQINKG